jgi:hypothetical protein
MHLIFSYWTYNIPPIQRLSGLNNQFCDVRLLIVDAHLLIDCQNNFLNRKMLATLRI